MIANPSVDDDDDFVPLSSVPKRRVVREDHAKGEHLYSVIIKKPGGWDGSFQVNTMSKDEALEIARSRIKRGDRILRIEDIGEYRAFDDEPYAGFDESGEEKEETDWFYSNGDIKRHFPKDCILGCSGGGSADDKVDDWVNELNFHVPAEKGLSYVQEYGLDDIGPEDVDKYVLWIMCGNIKEEAYEFCRDGSEWEYVDKDAYPEDIGDWEEEDWERFQSEVAVCHLGM